MRLLLPLALGLVLLGAGCSSSAIETGTQSNNGFTISSSNPAAGSTSQGISASGMGLFPTLSVSQ